MKFSLNIRLWRSPKKIPNPLRKSHSREKIPKVVQSVQELFAGDPGQFLRKLVTILNVNEVTMHRIIIKEDLRYKSYML